MNEQIINDNFIKRNSLSLIIAIPVIIAILIFAGVYFGFADLEKESQRHIMLGAWTEGLFDGTNKTLHPEKLLEFEKLVDKKMEIAHYYIGWEVLAKPELITQFETLRANSWQPMLNVNPYYFPEGCPASEVPLYKEIADGRCDDFLHNAGKNLANVKQPFFFVFAWEMNNGNNEWSVTKSGSSNNDFVAAWRHMHDIFKQEGATNVVWVFNPNVPEEAISPYKSIYPGDEYVDWVGLDGYNWGTTQKWSEWVDFVGVFKAAYDKITGIAPAKPVMLAEVNTTDQGGNKANWYKDMFIKYIPNYFPAIQAVVIFNEDKTKVENVNWKVDVTPESLEGFKQAIQTKYYK